MRVRIAAGRLASIVILLAITVTAAAQRTDITVAATGKADFRSVQAAIDAAAALGRPATLRIAPGTYREKLHVAAPGLRFLGTGKTPDQTVLSWDDSAASAGGTGRSGTLTVEADAFEAANLTIENTWEKEHGRTEQGSQAVALLLSSDRAVLDRVRILGAQDTLYANSRSCHDATAAEGSSVAATAVQHPCQASREYFKDCFIEGHVDFIFGDAKAVFDHCDLHTRPHPTVMITAQSRHSPDEDSGYFFLGCRITSDPGEPDTDQVYLGRPWRNYATVTFLDTEVDRPLAPARWLEWNNRLRTSTLHEINSHGPGLHGTIPQGDVAPADAVTRQLSPRKLLRGADAWDPVQAAEDLRQNR